MAERKTIAKKSSKATLNLDLNTKTTKKSTNELKKAVKKASPKGLVISLVCLLLGLVLGVGAWFIVCRNDKFVLLGEEEITLTLDESYVDEKVEIVEFGKDASTSYTTQTNLQVDANGKYYSTEVGTFYIKYKATTLVFGKIFNIQKVRLITFVEASEGENVNE